MLRMSALPSEVGSPGPTALWGTAGAMGARWTDGLASCLLSAQEGLGFLGFIKAFGGLSGSRSLWSLDSPRQGLNVYNPRLVRKAAVKCTGIQTQTWI